MGQRLPNPSARFDYMRKRAKEESNTENQQMQDAIKRRLAAGGQLNSGAGIKIQRQVQNDAAKNLQQANESINFAETEDQLRRDELESARKFAREERLGSQEFARGERLGTQQFQSGEAKTQRQFASKEAQRARGFEEKLFNRNLDFQKRQLGEQARQFEKQMELAFQQFDLDKNVSEFNMDMANKIFNKPTFLDNFFTAHGLDPNPSASPLASGPGSLGGFNPSGGLGRSSGGSVGGLF